MEHLNVINVNLEVLFHSFHFEANRHSCIVMRVDKL